MYAESETELRDLIIQNLETCGFLNKIKAELRAGVFLAFEEEGHLRKKIPIFNKHFDEFVETSNGKLVVSIVREFLEYFNLNFTLSVFDPEIANDSPCLNRSDLCSKLNIKNSDLDGPVLSALLKSKLGSDWESGTGKPSSFNPSSGAHLGNPIATTSKSLETISEDYPTKEKSRNGTFQLKNENDASFSSTFTISEKSEKEMLSNKNSSLEAKTPALDTSTKVKSSMIENLKNEFGRSESKEDKLKFSDILSNDKPDVLDVYKGIINSSSLDHDPFFDEPVPSEKQSIFNLPKERGLDSLNLKDASQNELNVTSTFESDKTTLSSLKDLPSLTSKGKDWTFNRDSPKTLPSLDSAKPSLPLEPSVDEEKKDVIEDTSQKNPDSESNEESSDKQLNSEESIEEELEEDFSGGLDDLLNSSLSLADDATSDQSVSQISVVDGVDHIEPLNSVN